MLFCSTYSPITVRLCKPGSGFAARALLTWLGALALGTGARAAETTIFAYDALGRLTATNVAGGPATGASTAIAYDVAGNRTRYQSTGLRPAPPLAAVVVLPINGLTVISIPSAGDPF